MYNDFNGSTNNDGEIMANDIIRVDFKTRRVLATQPIEYAPICSAYRRIAKMAGKPAQVLEVVGEPMDVDIQRIFPDSVITRWAYHHDGKPELARRYLSLIPPNANYELVIATHYVEEMAHIPFMLLNRWPDMLLRSMGTVACITHTGCPADIMAYVRMTMRMALKDVSEFTDDGLQVVVGSGLL